MSEAFCTPERPARELFQFMTDSLPELNVADVEESRVSHFFPRRSDSVRVSAREAAKKIIFHRNLVLKIIFLIDIVLLCGVGYALALRAFS